MAEHACDDRGASREPIAILGIGCRFPGGVTNPESFWRILAEGRDVVGEVPRDRWNHAAYYHPDPGRPGKTYTRAGAFLENLDGFDAAFFGISGREATRVDPQHRLLLECAWEALEDAGLAPESLAGRPVGVFVGISADDYLRIQSDHIESFNAYTMTGGCLSVAANRLSYFFDFRGPSGAIDTACSSSLVALHRGCQSLWQGEAELVLCGGANVILRPDGYVGFSKASMLSRIGRCRSFDAGADGFVRAEGAGVVVLKPLSRALADRDPVYAVLLATAENEDGRTSGMSLPNEAAQEALLREVYGKAGLGPNEVQYVEAHGTGTRAGDPIECRALGKVLGPERGPGEELRVGSAKTNFGHAEPASGIAGLIKTVLALEHRQLPASLHFQTPNPEIPFDQLHVRVQTRLGPWPQPGRRLIAGVNSFGFGGSNAHAVLAEFEETAAPGSPGPHPAMLFPISARAPEALNELAGRYREWLNTRDAVDLRDVAHTLAMRRSHAEQRLSIVAASREELIEALDEFLAGGARAGLAAGRARSERPRLAFVFCGNGSQAPGMGRELIDTEPVFREAVERCDRAYRKLADWSLVEELRAPASHSRMRRTEVAQPALLALQVGLVELWRSWGITPDASVGHSVGEIAAAWAAGRLGLDDALRVVYHRSRIQGKVAGRGRMAAAGLSPDEAERRLSAFSGRLSLAAHNSPRSVTISGDSDALEPFGATLEETGVLWRDLGLDYAFHSHQMDPLREDLLASLNGLRPLPGAVRFFSTVTGGELADGDLGSDYWWDNVRKPVLFAPVARSLVQDGHVFIEIGPHPILSGYVKEAASPNGETPIVIPSLRRGQEDHRVTRAALGSLYCAGWPLDWSRQESRGGRALRLPTYPWQKERHWVELRADGPRRDGELVHPLLGQRIDTLPLVFERELDTALIPYLADHRVQSAIVFPIAGLIEMGFGIARELFGQVPCSVENLEILRALVLSPEPPLTRTVADSDSGAFKIYRSESTAKGGWTETVRGEASKLPGDTPARSDLKAIRGRCPEKLDRRSFYRRLAERGLEYGAAFQGLRSVRRGEGEAFAEASLPPAALEGIESYRFHPALLDACIQAVVALAPEDDHAAYLPVRVDRADFIHQPGARAFAHARLSRRGPDSMTVDCTVLDSTGVVLAKLEGLRLQRIAFSKEDEHDHHLYRPRWEPRRGPDARAGGALPSPTEVVDAVAPELAGLCERHARRDYYARFVPACDALCEAYVVEALARLGWTMKPGEVVGGASELRKQLGIVEDHSRLFSRLLEFLEEREWLVRFQNGWRVARTSDPASSTELWRTLSREFPSQHAELLLLSRCGPRLGQVLRGSLDPLGLLFPGGSWSVLESVYDSGAQRLYNEILQSALAEIVRRLDRTTTLRVLEVGAGTGGTAAHALSVLPAERVEYVFTDVSETFLIGAQRRFSAYPFVQYRLLDLEHDPLSQGFERHSFDIVIGANVLHATRRLDETLGRLASLLDPGGQLMLVELAGRTAWFDLSFGLLKGAWSFEDSDVRSSYPLLGADEWKRLLVRNGYREPAGMADSAVTTRPTALVMMASAPPAEGNRERPHVPPTRGGGWLLLSRDEAAGTLKRLLEARGERVAVVDIEKEAAKPAEVLRTMRGEPAKLTGVVYLDALDALPAASMSSTDLEAFLRRHCVGVVDWINALSAASWDRPPRFWIVTRNSAAVPGQAVPIEPAQATLWGLGRVAMNEHPELRCAIVDVGGAADGSAEWEALAAELTAEEGAAGPDQEIALRGSSRYVHRLIRASFEPEPVRWEAGGDSSMRLDKPRRGALDRLEFRPSRRRTPGPAEIEIEVRACGLNFKDVMIGMGLLSGPTLERGWAGDALGLECAGTVVATGSEVSEFAVGDGVMAFGRHCFSTHVTTPASLAVRKPASMSFEEAATIPVAFLTAEYALRRIGRLRRGERVLIHGAAGGVGLAAIQIVRRLGGEMFATAGSIEKRDYLRALGVHHVMDSRSLAFADQVREITRGEGVDLVLNCLAREAIPRSLGVLRPFGRFLELGKRDLVEGGRLGLRPFQDNLSFTGIDLDQLMLKEPERLRGLMQRLVTLFARNAYRPLPHRVFQASRIAEAFRTMQQSKHIGKVVVSMEDRRFRVRGSDRQVAPPSPDSAYLITGGLGGLALATAERLVGEGARHLVLIGRNPRPDADARQVIERLEKAGADVLLRKADVSREQDVRDVLDEVARLGLRLKGVVHAAMVLDDSILLNLDEARLMRVVAPKALGAWNLHRETRDCPLDFFVMYSSVTAIAGNPGQANYCAANAFLDALAHSRKALGKPALSVGWGGISDVGYLRDRPETVKSLAQVGIATMPSSTALSMLQRLLRRDHAHVIAGPLDFRAWHRRQPAEHAVFSYFLGEAPSETEARPQTENYQEKLQALDRQKRPAFVRDVLVVMVSQVLGVAASRIDPDKSLVALGLDSLMAVELRQRVKDEMRANIAVMEILQGQTLAGLAARLAEPSPPLTH
jgi:acyl transferase domain-containing protein/SAM-dependent methyltransferase/acyl carrier protein